MTTYKAFHCVNSAEENRQRHRGCINSVRIRVFWHLVLLNQILEFWHPEPIAHDRTISLGLFYILPSVTILLALKISLSCSLSDSTVP